MKNIDNTQSIVLDLKGNIISSDDVLFNTNSLPSQCVLDWSPFVESIFPTLLKKLNQQKITFEKIKTIHSFLKGSYDFCFYQSERKDQITWVISDCSKFYADLCERQQFHHDCVIFKQLNLTY
ncbi:MAG: hypothetical protein AB8F94_04335 [Saprospiraceae bacterium]